MELEQHYSNTEIICTLRKKEISEVPIKQFSCALDIVTYLRSLDHYKDNMVYREIMVAIYINPANFILGYSLISTGGVTGVIADPRIILQPALLNNANRIILCHNHPSGSKKPSQPDLDITKKIKNAALLFDMKLQDHIILTEDDYYSFADEGLL